MTIPAEIEEMLELVNTLTPYEVHRCVGHKNTFSVFKEMMNTGSVFVTGGLCAPVEPYYSLEVDAFCDWGFRDIKPALWKRVLSILGLRQLAWSEKHERYLLSDEEREEMRNSYRVRDALPTFTAERGGIRFMPTPCNS